jgi:hypothetical protein
MDEPVELELGERIGMFYVGEIEAITPFKEEPARTSREEKLPDGIDLSNLNLMSCP